MTCRKLIFVPGINQYVVPLVGQFLHRKDLPLWHLSQQSTVEAIPLFHFPAIGPNFGLISQSVPLEPLKITTKLQSPISYLFIAYGAVGHSSQGLTTG